MSFFDEFGKELKTDNQIEKEQQSPYDIKAIKNKEGKIQIDFTEKNVDFKQFYDTTRLIIDGNRDDISPSTKECRVSWYGQDDAVMLDDNGEEVSRKTNYSKVLVDLDINSLLDDENYSIAIMKGLLNEKRVEKYLMRGLQENPEVPCGNYVGGILQGENRYAKVFSVKKGKMVHNSQEMINMREEHRRAEEEKKNARIQQNQEKIEKLQKEIEDLSSEK